MQMPEKTIIPETEQKEQIQKYEDELDKEMKPMKRLNIAHFNIKNFLSLNLCAYVSFLCQTGYLIFYLSHTFSSNINDHVNKLFFLQN
jgi:hypothetical protein